jgi:hypothetical protein
MYRLKLYHDYYHDFAGSCDLKAQHSMVYVLKGVVEINGERMETNNGKYYKERMFLSPLEADTVVWRWDLERTEAPDNLAVGEGVESHLIMSREIRMYNLAPGTKWVFMMDSLQDVPHHTTGLHHHPGGSGIRCMVKGSMSIRGKFAEESDNGPNDAWYEEGSYPIISTSGHDNMTFVKAMVSHVDYFNRITGVILDPVETGSEEGLNRRVIFAQEHITLS